MFFEHVAEMPVDPIFGQKNAFLKDQRANKLFLSVGVFQDKNLKTKMHGSIAKAVASIGHSQTLANYLPIEGDANFLDEIGKLIFGPKFYKDNSSFICAAQTVGGTSALRIGAENIFNHLEKQVFLTNPTWDNHPSIFANVGFEVFFLPYYNKEEHAFDFESFYKSIKSLPENSIIVLHACCHNPTGADPSIEQWKELSDLIKSKNIFPFFDFAYQGFKEGIEEDAFAIKYFAEQGHEMMVAYSCSKNFSLYNQRTGAIFVLVDNEKTAQKVNGHIKKTIRVNYSNPPSFGAKMVSEVLGKEDLKIEWVDDLKKARERILNMRKIMAKELTYALKKDFSFIEKEKGMFSLLGLTPLQVELLKEEYAIYMPSSGRINIAALSETNLDYFINSLAQVLKVV